MLVALGWTTIARVVRGAVLSLKGREYVQAAQALGAAHLTIVLRHLLPNALGPLLVAATLGVGSNMIAEAGLSFLGLGAQSPTLSWGALLADGQTFLVTAPWVAVFPGLALLLAVLGVNLLGDGLRDLLDPRWHELPRPRQRGGCFAFDLTSGRGSGTKPSRFGIRLRGSVAASTISSSLTMPLRWSRYAVTAYTSSGVSDPGSSKGCVRRM